MSLQKVRRLPLQIVCLAMLLTGQTVKDPNALPDEPRLPNGSSQKEEILKADHRKSLEDAGKLMELTEELKIELEKNDRHVLAVGTLKKLDEIEKLTKRIRGRLKRY
jgi:hypothetical protein